MFYCTPSPPFEVPLEVFDRLIIDACCSLVTLHLKVGFLDFYSRNTVRFCLVLQAPPIAGWPDRLGPTARTPFAPSTFADFIAHTGCSVPWCRIRTLALVVQSTCGFSVCIDTEGSHVPCNRLAQDQATYMPDTTPSVGRFRRSLSRRLLANRGFDIV